MAPKWAAPCELTQSCAMLEQPSILRKGQTILKMPAPALDAASALEQVSAASGSQAPNPAEVPFDSEAQAAALYGGADIVIPDEESESHPDEDEEKEQEDRGKKD